ncbi:MAG TPA: alkaline phosphatase family protein [Kofleriaceae bacterium]|nr:alkaline phosphatase family protein [Kofleriaceae bacterium]
MTKSKYLLAIALAACGATHAADVPDAAPDADTTPDAGPQLPTPIKYVVVIVKENHTFDNYFTGFPGAETTTKATLHDGTVITRPKAPDGALAGDISHSHASAVKDYANGKMNGFDLIVPSDPRRPFMYYREAQIPNYWQYARHFALFDHFFSTLAGPSSPGHFAIITAQTPHYGNPSCNDGSDECGRGCVTPDPNLVVPVYDHVTGKTSNVAPCFDVPTVVDHLPPGMTWRTYASGSGTSIGTAFNLVSSVGGVASVRDAHFRTYAQLMTDLATGDQANFTHVDVSSAPDGASEHPPAGPCTGENFTVDIVNAIMKGPHWNETAIVITWDDFGGFYDHVKPTIEKLADGSFYNTGFRLPALVISPYARQGVIKTVTEQASVPRLVEELWGLPMMSDTDPNARDGRAGSMLGAFDFTQPPRAPLVLEKRTCP